MAGSADGARNVGLVQTVRVFFASLSLVFSAPEVGFFWRISTTQTRRRWSEQTPREALRVCVRAMGRFRSDFTVQRTLCL